MRILVVSTHVPFVRGGAELLAEGLVAQLRAAGHEAELVQIPFKWYPPHQILDCALANALLDLSAFTEAVDLCIALKFPAYLVQHPRLAVWLLHQHRQAYDLWGTELSDLSAAPDGAEVRDIIRASDREALGRVRTLCTISQNVTDRLARFNGLQARTVYHPPPLATELRCDGYEDFLFFPSRINASKRQELVLDALARTKSPVRFVFAGAADDRAARVRFLERLGQLGLKERVSWLGAVDGKTLVDLYARCRGVVFTPVDEDYGYVTLEAMLARKAVLTLSDSGGPTEFIRDGQEGLIVRPDVDSLARALDRFWEDRAGAERMGEQAFQRYGSMDISWEAVIAALLA